LIHGRDELGGVEVDTVFCSSCDWRAELCPNCGSEELDVLWNNEEAGDEVRVIRCMTCHWHETGAAEPDEANEVDEVPAVAGEGVAAEPTAAGEEAGPPDEIPF